MSKKLIYTLLSIAALVSVFVSGCAERYGITIICLIFFTYFYAQISSLRDHTKTVTGMIKSFERELDAFEEIVGNSCVKAETYITQLYRRLTSRGKCFTTPTGKAHQETIAFHESSSI